MNRAVTQQPPDDDHRQPTQEEVEAVQGVSEAEEIERQFGYEGEGHEPPHALDLATPMAPPIRTTSAIDKLAAALAKAQGDVGDPTKNEANPYFNSRYADLAQVLGVIRPALSVHGLSLTQWPTIQDGCVQVTTRLMHESGQWMECDLSCVLQIRPTEEVEEVAPQGRGTIKKKKQGTNVAQAMGTLITYLRRYSAAAVVGVAQIDADANDLDGQPANPSKGGELL